MLRKTMLKQPHLRNLLFTWLVWAVIVIGFPVLLDTRLELKRPDRALSWTPNETARNSQNGKIYLLDPFMNRQVSWDSEFYLSIATVGYDDPAISVVDIPGGERLSKNYAFFPMYPYTIRIVRFPLQIFGLTPIATSTLAGVLVSLVGAFFGMLALFDLARAELEESGAYRAVFYLLIFPTGFFLAQVYTEGLFIALAFGSLALARRKQLFWAALLAAFATWTRALGAVLIIPLALAWLDETGGWRNFRFSTQALLRGLLVLVPVLAYAVWYITLGVQHSLVEDHWFGRSFLDMERFSAGVQFAVEQIMDGGNPQMRAYYLLEFFGVGLAIVACLATLRRYPGVALFGLLGLAITITTGAPQSLIRYVLVVPSIYIFLSRLGRNTAFDRGWTVFSILLLGMQLMLFSVDMWVA
ncbi:MAG: hypothetical protein H6671_03590 [Anaerolineaceae bacterium]|nr:hypothetical protein [Anaerolineaceae bacterium]